MKFTQLPANTFKELQINAGILLKDFDPLTATIQNTDIIGATSGGLSFTDVPSYKDNGEGIDNCPKNTKELKQIESREVQLSGSFVTINSDLTKTLMGAAEVSETKITPRDMLKDTDFEDLWLVADYSNENGTKNGGYVAIHMMNTLNTGGFSMQTSDKDKGKFAFNFMAHYSATDQDKVPYEVYVKAGTPEL